MNLYIVLGGYLHLGCTQCSILLHLIDICFHPYISLISQIQTCLRVAIGPGLISTSTAFMKSRLPKKGKSAPYCEGERCRHNLHSGLPVRSDHFTACRLCHLEPIILIKLAFQHQITWVNAGTGCLYFRCNKYTF